MGIICNDVESFLVIKHYRSIIMYHYYNPLGNKFDTGIGIIGDIID